VIYFDHNATTPMLPEVIEAMHTCMASKYANPSSLHAMGRQSRSIIEEGREKLADLVNAHPSQIVFTSGGTESNNLALKGSVEGMGIEHFAYSAVEHPSVRDVAKYLSRTIDVTELSVFENGELDMSFFTQYCQSQSSSSLISVMLANNETGVLQDVATVGELAKEYGHLVHTDAVQGLGKVVVDFKALNVNLMSLSAHKLNGPKGIGALVFDKALNIAPLFHGGGQERGLRSGTENIAAIAGFAKAVEITKKTYEEKTQIVSALRDYLEAELRKISDVVIFAEEAPRLPNTTFFGFPGIDGESLVMQLDNSNIAVTSGSACSSKSGKPSHVLSAMGVDEELARSAVRVSLGTSNTRHEVDEFIHVLGQQCKMINSLKAIV
jgi:cysteine desulfurase